MRKEHARAGKPAAPAHRKIAEHVGARLPVIIVLLFCLVFAVRLGALQPELHFQKVSAENGIPGGNAYAMGDTLLFKVPHAQDAGVRALFLGTGRVSSVSYTNIDQSANVTKIALDGKVACSPCIAGKEYPADAAGDAAVEVFARQLRKAAGIK